MMEPDHALLCFAKWIFNETGASQQSFLAFWQNQVINPVQQQRTGFVAHPLRELSRKTVPSEKILDAF